MDLIGQIAALSFAIAGLMEGVKKMILQPAKVRLGLTDYQYSVSIYVLVGLVAAGVVFMEPAQWDFLREFKTYGYPVWFGNLFSIAAIVGGEPVWHTLIEVTKRLADLTEPKPGSGGALG